MSELRLKQYQIRALEALRDFFVACHQCNSVENAFIQENNKVFGTPNAYRKIDETHLKEIPYVCLRVPTGGGKTLMACKAVAHAIRDFKQADSSIVLWLVPSTAILEQTLAALRNPDHPYRQCLESSLHNVVIKSIDEALSIPLSDVSGRSCIIVSTLQAFRRDSKDGLRVYKDGNSALAPHFEHIPTPCLAEVEYNPETKEPVRSLKNLLAMHRPVVIIDEAHNARTPLSFNVLDGFHPSCIVEFTATPDTKMNPSNVLYSVSARELQAEDMIKMPIEVVGRPSAWRELIQDAVNCRCHLEKLAEIERIHAPAHEYLRPILLFQAMKKNKNDESVIHAEKLKELLIKDYRIPEEEIRLATGENYEIEKDDLFSPECKVRYIITQQALREGWDCSFAYVLCSIAESWSKIQVEQFIGRIMRLPHVMKKETPELNKAYVFAPASFTEVAESLRDGLINNGFQKFEAEKMVRESPGVFNDELFPPEYFDCENMTTTIRLTAIPETIPQFSELLATRASYDTTGNTITFKNCMSTADREELHRHFPKDKPRIDWGYMESNRYTPEKLSRIETGYEFRVPQLVVQESPELFRLFTEDVIYEYIEYERRDLTAALLRLDYHTSAGEITQGEIGMNQKGEVTSHALQILQEQSFAWDFEAASQWSEAELVNWLDERLEHSDIIAADMTAALSSVLLYLIKEKQLNLQQLVIDKYILSKSFREALNKFRKELRKRAYQLCLFPECRTPLTVNPECCFQYKEAYPVNNPYSGKIKFNKHLYPEVGTLNKEEEECAQILDLNPKIDCWVRNLERQEENSFWLQTSTDKFYPDFICKLTDGRILAVEYKGDYLYSGYDSSEKKIIGELWAKRSGGKCLFIMTDGKNTRQMLERQGL